MLLDRRGEMYTCDRWLFRKYPLSVSQAEFGFHLSQWGNGDVNFDKENWFCFILHQCSAVGSCIVLKAYHSGNILTVYQAHIPIKMMHDLCQLESHPAINALWCSAIPFADTHSRSSSLSFPTCVSVAIWWLTSAPHRGWMHLIRSVWYYINVGDLGSSYETRAY